MTLPNVPIDTKPGTPLLVDGLPAVFVGHYSNTPVFRWTDLSKVAPPNRLRSLGCCLDVARSLGFDPNDMAYDDNSACKTIEIVKEEPMQRKRYLTENDPPGTRVILQGRKATVVLHNEGAAHCRFDVPQPGDLLLDTRTDSEFIRAAKALGLDPYEMAYQYGYYDQIEWVSDPIASKSPFGILIAATLLGGALSSMMNGGVKRRPTRVARVETMSFPSEGIETKKEMTT